ncbi:hypothetical protein L484_013922 [Morus notabilis]|uniref:Mediator of RNA polymerase II transcription subunit 25 n=1 Tax=Morus notabilis TaxID=981085 RepID=W9R551_9ROSA|nr:hypothetical protein L484_013922 [Morus notabilis]
MHKNRNEEHKARQGRSKKRKWKRRGPRMEGKWTINHECKRKKNPKKISKKTPKFTPKFHRRNQHTETRKEQPKNFNNNKAREQNQIRIRREKKRGRNWRRRRKSKGEGVLGLHGGERMKTPKVGERAHKHILTNYRYLWVIHKLKPEHQYLRGGLELGPVLSSPVVVSSTICSQLPGIRMAEKQLIVAVEGTAAMGPYWPTVLSDYLEKIVRSSPPSLQFESSPASAMVRVATILCSGSDHCNRHPMLGFQSLQSPSSVQNELLLSSHAPRTKKEKSEIV